MVKTCLAFGLICLIIGVLTACTALPPLQPASAPPPAAPQPEQLVVFDGASELILAPGDAAYTPIAHKLAELIAAMDTPIYAYYPPERVAAEIMPVPHLEAAYSRSVTLGSATYQVPAERLIVVVAHAEKIILTKAPDRANWDACETSQPARFDALLQTVKDQTGVNLLP